MKAKLTFEIEVNSPQEAQEYQEGIKRFLKRFNAEEIYYLGVFIDEKKSFRKIIKEYARKKEELTAKDLIQAVPKLLKAVKDD